MDPKKGKRRGLKPKGKELKEKPKSKKQSLLNWFGGFVLLFVGWSILIFVFFLIMSIGSDEVYVLRNKQVEYLGY